MQIVWCQGIWPVKKLAVAIREGCSRETYERPDLTCGEHKKVG